MDKHFVVLVGLPGSGKSTLCARAYNSYTRISQDEQGKDGHKIACRIAMDKGENIIVDRCGFNVEQRQRYIKPAKEAGYKTTIIWIQTSPEECIARIKNRKGHPNLDAEKASDKIESVVMGFHKDFKAPTEVEADEVIKL